MFRSKHYNKAGTEIWKIRQKANRNEMKKLKIDFLGIRNLSSQKLTYIVMVIVIFIVIAYIYHTYYTTFLNKYTNSFNFVILKYL